MDLLFLEWVLQKECNIMKNLNRRIESYLRAISMEDYVSDIILLSTKSIITLKENRLVILDFNRFKDEMLLYKYYGKEIKNPLKAQLFLPMLIGTSPFEIIREEITSLLPHIFKDSKRAMESLLFLSIYHTLLVEDDGEISLENAKEKLIDTTYKAKDKSEEIIFQKIKIKLLMLFGKPHIKELKEILEEAMDILNFSQEEKSSIEVTLENQEVNSSDFKKKMAEYLMKLLEFKLERERYNEKVILREIVELKEKEIKTIPILGKVEVFLREENQEGLKLGLRAKGQEYIFNIKKN